MTADWIACVNGPRDCEFVKRYYTDSWGVRILLKTLHELGPKLPEMRRLWIDGGTDALHCGERMKADWKEFFDRFEGGQEIREKGMAGSFGPACVNNFVSQLLAECTQHNPAWISVPQVPVSIPEGSEQNARKKLNKAFARAAGEWRTQSGWRGKLMLPVLLYGAEVLTKKTNWARLVGDVERKISDCQCEGLWVVNADLDDEQGSAPNERKRFPQLVSFHTELKRKVPDSVERIVVGPYWAMGIVLWARRLATNPLIGLGGAYQYYFPSGHVKRPHDRIAIPCLRRRVVVTPGLSRWLQDAAARLSADADSAKAAEATTAGMTETAKHFTHAARELQSLYKQLPALRDYAANEQVARFYRDWLDRVAAAPLATRNLALHQDLATAHLVGQIVGSFPAGIRPRQASALARQYMLSCL